MALELEFTFFESLQEVMAKSNAFRSKSFIGNLIRVTLNFRFELLLLY